MVEKDYVRQRDGFKKKKAGLLEEISKHQSQIDLLAKQIEDEMPRTENGRILCESCDWLSVRYVGRIPRGGLAGGDDIYECEICEKQY